MGDRTGERRRGTRRERWVAGVGVLAALLLAGVALGPWADAEAAADRAREGVARTTRSLRRAAWDELRERGVWESPVGSTFRWTAGHTRRPQRPAPHAVSASTPGGSRAFATRLAAAEVLEVYDTDAESALERVLAALDEDGITAGQRALGRLRAVQLAACAGRTDVVREQWAHASGELDGAETADGLPILLSAGLVAAGALADEDERCAIARRLSQAWGAGELALADEPPIVVAGEGVAPPVVTERPRLAALARRLEALAEKAPVPTNGAPGDGSSERPDCFDPTFFGRRERWLAAGLRELVGPLPEPLRAGHWDLHATPAGPFAVRGTPDGRREGTFVDPRGVGAELVRRLGAAPSPAEGEWTVETAPGGLTGDASLLGGWVAVRLAFPGGEPPAVRAARRQALLLRWGLLLAAFGVGAAGIVTARALRRERRLGELKSTFVANVSHELRTPLASILLMAENLEEGRVPDEAARARYFANLRREAQRLRRLVGDVLDFSRLERGAGPRLERAELALGEWWSAVAAEAEDRGARDGVEVRAASDGLDGRLAWVDGEALRRVAANLVDNAVKYGAPPIEVRAHVNDDELVLVVTDHGPGIPAAERDAVFEPFRRLAEGAVPAGTGLGLAIVRALVAAHGGVVTVTSGEDGRGTRVEVRVPLDGSAGEESE